MISRGPTDADAAALADVERALTARWPESTMEPSLARITALVDLLGDPQRAYPAVHITGTNGKTTTARMVDALLREHQLRTGRYTSPHLESVTERICLDGRPLTPARFAAVYAEVEPYLGLVDAVQPHPLSFFEVLTGMAFAAFADAPVDVAVAEVGLGGRWDATNVIDAPVAVVTPIDLDHTRLLGGTVEAIAAEKAGIIKPGAVAVLAQQPPGAEAVLEAHALEVGATVRRAGLEYDLVHRTVAVGGQLLTLRAGPAVYDDVFIPLHGAHQAGNAATALAAVQAFLGGEPPEADLVRAGFARADSPGRLEIVRRSPTVLLDGAHNPAGARALAAAVAEAFSFRRLIGVLAVLSDKDSRGLLEALEPVLDAVVVTTNASPRALPVRELAATAADVLGPDRVRVADRLDAAIELAVGWTEEDTADLGGGGVLVTGSIVTVGEARTLLRGRPPA